VRLRPAPVSEEPVDHALHIRLPGRLDLMAECLPLLAGLLQRARSPSAVDLIVDHLMAGVVVVEVRPHRVLPLSFSAGNSSLPPPPPACPPHTPAAGCS